MDGFEVRHGEARLEMYRRTAAEALAEIDELQSEILAAQARVATTMTRVRALEGLVAAVRAVVGPSVELPVNLRPVRIEGLSEPLAEALPQRRRDRVRLPATDSPDDGWYVRGGDDGVGPAPSAVPERTPAPEVFDSWRAAGLRRP